MRHIKSYLVLASACLLASCAGDKKEPLEGERKTVFLEESKLAADPSLTSKTPSIGTPTHLEAWSMASGCPSHAVPPCEFSGKYTKTWSNSVGAGSAGNARLINGPVAAEGKVFTVDTKGVVYATSLKNGDKVWSTDSTPDNTSSQPFSGGLAYEAGLVFVSTPSAEVVILDAKTGKIQKRLSLTAPVRAAPTVQNGLLYVVTINNQLEVFDYTSGEPLWSHNGMLENAGLLGGSSPALDQGVVVVPYTSGEVYALQGQNGTPLWSESLTSFNRLDSVSSIFHIKARPVIYNQMVFLISHGGQMRALDLRSGETKWLKDVGGIRSPAVSGNALFMVTNTNDLVCLECASGKIFWSQKLPMFKDGDSKSDAVMWAGPILVNDQLVLAGSHGKALVINASTGQTVKELSLPHRTSLSPIAVDGHVVFFTDDAELVAFN